MFETIITLLSEERQFCCLILWVIKTATTMVNGWHFFPVSVLLVGTATGVNDGLFLTKIIRGKYIYT